ncbi:MFS transporter [candidate division KSB1 bacterium]
MNTEKYPDTAPRKRLYLDKNLLIAFCITLTAIMSVSIIAPAIPKIIRELDISPQAVGLLITAFTLPGVVLTPVLGVMADRYGRKKILVPSLMLFGIAGGLCAFIPDFELLIAMRFVQGMGAAALGSLNVTIIGDLFSGRERTAAMGYNSSVLSVGTAVYPSIGGAVAVIGWNYPFLLAFLGIPVGLLVMFNLRNPEPKNSQRLSDYLKNLAVSLYNRRVIGLFISSGMTFVILYGVYITYLPIFLAERFGYSTLIIGMIMSSVSVTTVITSSQLGNIVRILPEKRILMCAFLIHGTAILLIPFSHSLPELIMIAALMGVAHGTNIPTTISLLSGLAPMEYRAAFMATNGMSLRFGQTAGPLIMGLMYALGGTKYVFLTGTGIALFMFFFMIIIFKQPAHGGKNGFSQTGREFRK